MLFITASGTKPLSVSTLKLKNKSIVCFPPNFIVKIYENGSIDVYMKKKRNK